MPRLTPITGKAEVPAAHHGVVDAVVKVFGNVRGPFSMLLHSPKLADRLLPLVTFLRDVMLYARQLMRGNRLDPALFDKLNSCHGAPWMVEVAAANLYFAFVAGIA